jgi:predicted transcriptional regulator
MKKKSTDDMVKALQNGIKSIGSLKEFSDRANVSKETLAHFLSRKTHSLTADTWEKIYPLVRPYIPENTNEVVSHVTRARTPKVAFQNHTKDDLSSDEKILLDAFESLSPEVRNKKLIEIVELARNEISRKTQE